MLVKLIKWLLKRVDNSHRHELFTHVLEATDALPLHGIIVVDDAGKLLIRGKTLDYEQALLLRESAKAVLNSPAWKLVHEQALYLGVSEGFLKAQSEKHVLFGQAAVWFGQQEKDILAILAGDPGNSPLSGD